MEGDKRSEALRVFLVLSFLISVIFLRTTSLGHGGRLNARGCHNQTSDNSVHCHQTTKSEKKTKFLEKIRVIDGDTIEGFWQSKLHKVRLAEIDAPEHDQPWGLEATKALSERIEGRTVRLFVVDRDRYGRLVAKPYLGKDDICLEMVRAGHAWAYRKYLKDKDLLEAENRARIQDLGLWGNKVSQPIPPWGWRKGKR